MKEELPPIQFKNPDVQFLLLKNRKPTPFVDVYLGRPSYITYNNIIMSACARALR